MKPHSRFNNANELATYLRKLHEMRHQLKMSLSEKGSKRKPLTKEQRKNVLLKTDGRCHICGGKILGGDWQADHVLAYAQGGIHSAENYLPAHPICNNYRWDYGQEEFQWILKIGVWMRTQIENENRDAMMLAERFVKYEAVRESRPVMRSVTVKPKGVA